MNKRVRGEGGSEDDKDKDDDNEDEDSIVDIFRFWIEENIDI